MRIVESRKLQKTGCSTIIVSLPKKWTEKLGLTPSSEVRLIEQTDGSLNIDPNIDTNALTKRCQILEVEKGTGNHLFRSLIGIYLTGSNEIKVLGKPRLCAQRPFPSIMIAICLGKLFLSIDIFILC